MAKTGRFRRTDRLLDARDFRRVLRRGRRRAHPDLVVVRLRRDPRPIRVSPVRTNEKSSGNGRLGSDHSVGARRLGITASRKVGNAVRRNRFKRRVREWFRRRRWELEPGLDVVVIARRSGAELEMEELDERLSGLLGLVPGSDALREDRRGPERSGASDGTGHEHA